MKRLIFVLLGFILCPACHAGTKEKKFIEYGWDCPDTAYVRKHYKEMEQIPFDGVVIKVMNTKLEPDTMGWTAFSKLTFKPEDYQHAIDDLKATKFKRFTDNFIQVVSSEGVDWFDPEWPKVAHNVACLAKVAKEGGCKGIMFDPEMYGKLRPYSYSKASGHTLEEYRAKARERGVELIKAVNKEYPDITILCLFGPSLPYLETGGNPVWFEGGANILLAAFYDGICEAATPKTTLIDGYEFSYGYRRQAEFVKARKTILEDSIKISTRPDAFKKHVRAGFGIWADWNSGSLGWHPEDFTKNYFTPAGLRSSLNYALDTSDGYVWVYSERLRWWDGKSPPPQEYADALRLAKLGPGAGDKNPMAIITEKRKAADITGYSDEETFTEIRKSMTEVYDLPKDQWLFSFDDLNSGVKAGWFNKNFNDSAWRYIMIGKLWEEQAGDYDGAAWYRKKFTAPQIESGKQVFIAFGAVDDIAKVWLNGQYVGQHDVPLGWNKPFVLEVTKTIKPGQPNVLAVEVIDNGGTGGIWKSVKLMVK